MSKPVFLSHAVRDTELVSLFIDFLQNGLGLGPTDVFCTSELQSIFTGSDFTDEIKNQITNASIVLFLLTPAFFESRFCVSEIGAAWATNRRLYPILVPPIDFKDLDSTPLRSVNSIKICEPVHLDKMRDEFSQLNLGGSVDTSRYNSKKEKFLTELSSLGSLIDYEHERDNLISSELQVPNSNCQQDIERLRAQIALLQDSRPETNLALTITNGENGITLSVRNSSSSTVTIRLLSVRNDIASSAAYRPIIITARGMNFTSEENIVGFVIGPQQVFDFHMPLDQKFSFTDYQWISSVSIFYRDEHNKCYRAQIGYVWELAGGEWVIRSDVFKECYRIETLPGFDPFSTDVRRITELENNKAVRYHARFRPYHSSRVLTDISGTLIPGNSFTNGQPMTSLKVHFTWEGHPIFDLVIGEFVAFSLMCIGTENGIDSYKVFDADHNSQNSSLYDGLTSPRKYREYGLVSDGPDEDNLRELYNHVNTYLLRGVNV